MGTTADFTITIDGSGALVSNVSQHSGDRKNFVQFRDLVTDVAKRIVKRDGKGATLGDVAGTEVQVIHEYVYTDPTTGATTNHILGAIDGGAYIYRWGGASWSGQTLPITPTAGGRWFFLNVDNRVLAVNGKNEMIVGIQTGATTITWSKVGQAAPVAAATYSLSTADGPYNAGTLAATKGSATCTGTGTTWVTGATWVGKRININGVYYTILSVASTTSLTLTENFKEDTAAGLTYNIYRGIGDWINPPRYTWAYYNPTTGHLSNVAPVTEITEQNVFGRTVTITIAGSAANTTAYNNGFTQIQLFRSAANGYVLCALNEKLSNNNTASSITYTEDATKFRDSYLTDLLAPFDQNGVPPTGISCLAYHQDRVWGYVPKTGRLHFTPTAFEIDYGVAVECWPVLPQFSRRIAEVSGLLPIGDDGEDGQLVIQTPRGDFTIAGFNALTFRVKRMRTRRSGSFLYSATEVDGDLVSFYRDRRLLAYPGGVDLGIAIQDKLNLVRKSLMSNVRLHWYASDARNFLLLSVPSGPASTANDYTYVFDLDKGGVAYEWNAGFSAFGTVHDASTAALELWGGSPDGAAYRLLNGSTQDAGSNFQPVLKTSIIRPFEPDAWGDLAFWEIYASDVSGTWTGRVYIHEQTSSGATDGTAHAVTFRAPSGRGQTAQGKKLVYTPTASLRTQSNAFQFEVTFPSQNAALHIEKMVLGFKNKDKKVA
jgi:hypothetical protein